MASAKDRILDSFEDILIKEGERAATMDAVAAAAGVSKGGLLYHFPSKEAMVEGLCARLAALTAEDAEKIGKAPEGAARRAAGPQPLFRDWSKRFQFFTGRTRFPRRRKGGGGSRMIQSSRSAAGPPSCTAATSPTSSGRGSSRPSPTAASSSPTRPLAALQPRP